MQFTNVIKNGRHCQVIGLDKRSETLEDCSFVKLYTLPLISPKGKLGTDRPKCGKK